MSLTVDKCIQAWTNSLRQMNAKADIVFFGDSLTYYGDFSTIFPDKVVCNLGLRGDTIQGMIERVEQVWILEPKTVYLMVGINDVPDTSIFDYASYYRRLIDRLQCVLPNSKFVIQSLLPVNNKCYNISCSNDKIVSYNIVLEQIARDFRLCYLDLFSIYAEEGLLPSEYTIDGIHLKQNAYQFWMRSLTD